MIKVTEKYSKLMDVLDILRASNYHAKQQRYDDEGTKLVEELVIIIENWLIEKMAGEISN